MSLLQKDNELTLLVARGAAALAHAQAVSDELASYRAQVGEVSKRTKKYRLRFYIDMAYRLEHLDHVYRAQMCGLQYADTADDGEHTAHDE